MIKLPALLAVCLLAGCAQTNVTPNEHSINYSNRAWKLDVKGNVTALYDVNSSGKTENVRIVSAKPKSIFDDQVKASIYQWRFEPNKPRKNIAVHIVFDKP